jgi:hypothetical protein
LLRGKHGTDEAKNESDSVPGWIMVITHLIYGEQNAPLGHQSIVGTFSLVYKLITVL